MKKRRKTILITAGPTREHIDPVRFISNLSSGRLGYEIAQEARRRGHKVILISGPTSLPAPSGIKVIHIVSADELEKKVFEFFRKAHILFMTSAVCDYQPSHFIRQKIKRKKDIMLHLKSTHDILKKIAKHKKDKIVCGFSLETHDLLRQAYRKLNEKKMDFIVASLFKGGVNPFGEHRMKPIILDKFGSRYSIGVKTKKQLAVFLLNLTERGK